MKARSDKKYTWELFMINAVPFTVAFFIWPGAILIGIPLAFFSAEFLFRKKEYIGALWCLIIGLLELSEFLSQFFL